MPRIVRVFVGVEYVDDGDLADSQDHAVRGLRATELIEVGIDLLDFAAEVDGLAEECPCHAVVRVGLPKLVGFTAEIPGNAEAVTKAEALIDLRIEPDLRPLPGTKSEIDRGIDGFPAVRVRREALRAGIGRSGRPAATADVFVAWPWMAHCSGPLSSGTGAGATGAGETGVAVFGVPAVPGVVCAPALIGKANAAAARIKGGKRRSMTGPHVKFRPRITKTATALPSRNRCTMRQASPDARKCSLDYKSCNRLHLLRAMAGRPSKTALTTHVSGVSAASSLVGTKCCVRPATKAVSGPSRRPAGWCDRHPPGRCPTHRTTLAASS